MSKHDDAQLLEAARSFDLEALGAIHDAYYDPVYRYMIARVSHRSSAEDLTSEVFTRLLSSLRTGSPPRATLRGWLFGVAGNVVADHHRRAYRAEHVPLDESLESVRGHPDRTVGSILEREGLLGALDELTDDQREVIALRYGAELPIRETARLMGRTEGAVKQLQARAVARLGRVMARGSDDA